MQKFNYTMTKQEVAGILGTKYSVPYKMQGHHFIPLARVGKNYCTGCGLVRLRNKISDWCVDKGCNYSDHTAYPAALKRLTKCT